MANMTAEMLEHVNFLCDHGVLVDARIAEHEYRKFGERYRKTMHVGCADCDRLKDQMVFHGTVIGEKFHPIGAIHGGGSAFHPSSLMMPSDAPAFPYDYYVYEIKRGAEIKNTRKVSFYSHTPCSAAGAAGLSVPQVIELQLVNRDLLDEHLAARQYPMEVVPYFHVDYGNLRKRQKDKRTFLVSRAAWLEVRDRFGTEHLDRLPFRLNELVA